MALVVSTGIALSLTTGTKSADQVSGVNTYVQKGRIQLFAKASAAAATGIRATLAVGGITLMDDQLVTFSGSAGALDVNANGLIDQVVSGGRVVLTFRNDSAGTLTVDHQLLFTAMK